MSRIDIRQGKETVSEIIVMNVAQIVNSVVKGAVPCHRAAPLSFENTTISARPAPTSRQGTAAREHQLQLVPDHEVEDYGTLPDRMFGQVPDKVEALSRANHCRSKRRIEGNLSAHTMTEC